PTGGRSAEHGHQHATRPRIPRSFWRFGGTPGTAVPGRRHEGASLTLRRSAAYHPRLSNPHVSRRFHALGPRWQCSESDPSPTGERPMEATKTKLVEYRVKNGVAWLELTD